MATLRQIKDKQQSVKTINKITKAMQLVSSAKSQKALKELKDYKGYFSKVERIIGEINKGTTYKEDSFDGTYWILIMSDLGLAGGYNHNLLKEFIAVRKPEDKFLILGTKGAGYVKKNKEQGEWFTMGDLLTIGNQLGELTTRIKTEHYDNNQKVKIMYSDYVSQMEFVPVSKTILPIEPIKIEEDINDENKSLAVTEFEPNKEDLLKELESIYINSLIVNAYKEASASEHTARKNAMESATQNGEELLDKLDIEYNRGRQAKITQEISEIIGGAESLK